MLAPPQNNTPRAWVKFWFGAYKSLGDNDMHYKFQTFFSLWLAAWLSLCAPALVLAQAKDAKPDEIDVQSIKAPPRNVKDILRILDQSKSDKTDFDRASEVLQRAAPADASDVVAMNAYHYRKSLAFQSLGKLDEAVISSRLAAIDFKHPKWEFEMRDLINLAVIENFIGNQQTGIKLLISAKVIAERNRANGFVLSINRLLVGMYSTIGNFEAAKLALLEADAQMVMMRRSPRLAEFSDRAESQLESARGVYFSSQGLWIESERSLRKAIRYLELSYQAAKASPKSVDELAEGPRALTDGSNSTRQFITQISSRTLNLSEVVLQQRKLVDAEFYAREAMKLSLDNFGRNSSDVGRALATLSRIISEQGRFDEALLLAKASMTAHAESGITDESRTMAVARKFYATALVANGQYKDADTAFTQMMASVQKDPELAKTFNRNDLDWVMAMQKIGKGD
ncbi:MAG: hypothetical protein EBZ61_11125, partial [Micrococcales bacterium]|nr:hypothetical protein [Micrococcales bacterium]